MKTKMEFDVNLREKIKEFVELEKYIKEAVQQELIRFGYSGTRTCMCCNFNKVQLITPIYPLDISCSDILNQENCLWEGGTVQKVGFGYGSCLDCQSFYIAVCDDCMKKAVDAGVATPASVIDEVLTKNGYGITKTYTVPD